MVMQAPDLAAFLTPAAPPMGMMGAPAAPAPVAPLPGGGMPPLPPEMMALMAALAQRQQPEAPIVSDLDRWAMKHHGVRADMLPDDAMNGLTGYIRTLAEADRTYWQPRNDRIADEISYYELQRPDSGVSASTASAATEKTAEDEAENAEIIISPIPRLVVDKLTAMLAAAEWPIEVPARTIDGTAAAQKVENLLMWFQQGLARNFARTQHETLSRKTAMSGLLTGWLCALMLPDPAHPRFPWIFRLEDPTLVYPRFSDNGLQRVTRQFIMTALEARAEYPELDSMLEGYQDDDTVTICGYYDQIYRAIIVEGMDSRSADAMAVMRPIKHGSETLDGEPQCPWIIHLPNGKGFSPTRQAFGSAASGRRGGPDTATVGVGVLYVMRGTYGHINKLASQLATNVARSADPPIVQYLQPNEEPKEIKFVPGGRNFLTFQRNSIDILETTPNGGDLGPLMGLLQDWLSKATLPGVYWGESGGATSGFMINILANAAKHVILSYADGLRHFQMMVYEMAIETLLVAMTRMGVPPLPITRRMDQGRLAGGTVITPEDLMAVNTEIEVSFMDLSAQDIAGAVQTELMAVQGRFHSRETAMRKTGVQDVELESARIDLDALLADPAIAVQMGPLEAANPNMSTRERLLQALAIKTQLLQQQQAMEQMAAQQGGRSAPPAKPGVSTSTLPSEMGGARAGMAPAEQDPAQQQAMERNRMIAQMSAMSGGSPPAPQR